MVKELGIDILLDSQVTLAHNTAYDISQQVIAKADAAQRREGQLRPVTGRHAQGSRMLTSVGSKSVTFRVTSVRP